MRSLRKLLTVNNFRATLDTQEVQESRVILDCLAAKAIRVPREKAEHLESPEHLVPMVTQVPQECQEPMDCLEHRELTVTDIQDQKVLLVVQAAMDFQDCQDWRANAETTECQDRQDCQECTENLDCQEFLEKSEFVVSMESEVS